MTFENVIVTALSETEQGFRQETTKTTKQHAIWVTPLPGATLERGWGIRLRSTRWVAMPSIGPSSNEGPPRPEPGRSRGIWPVAHRSGQCLHRFVHPPSNGDARQKGIWPKEEKTTWCAHRRSSKDRLHDHGDEDDYWYKLMHTELSASAYILYHCSTSLRITQF
jgi:hypothetical protein